MHPRQPVVAWSDDWCPHPKRARIPVLVVPVAGARETIARAIEAHIDHMATYTLPAIEPGFVRGWDHALRLIRLDGDFLAERVAQTLAAVPPEGEEADRG
jgi:hypothetical protein